MKHVKVAVVVSMVLTLMLAGCSTGVGEQSHDSLTENAVEIVLGDDGISVDGAPVGDDTESAVFAANDIIYYEAGKGIAYGEGADSDAHDEEEAGAHTVVHITEPGAYSISGTLSRGQIAVDLGDGAKGDPNAVVTLILNGVDITCEVAPAVIFYNVYECGSDDAESASEVVGTSAAGANVIIADDTVNSVDGSYVARIYEPDSVVLSEDGAEVEDADKLHKYDGAFYSKMSMNISGGAEDTGVLNIQAENEGICTELHLTVNGGTINIQSGNDGINTNEDGVSVTTLNGGALNIEVTGETGEGDGIDSNGWLVINGGRVVASACSDSADAGIDSDMGIHINGGTVAASGHMLDRIQDGGQTYVVFSFQQTQDGSSVVCLKDEAGEAAVELSPQNDYSTLIFSGPELTSGTYTLWVDGQQMAAQAGGMTGMPVAPGMAPSKTAPVEPPKNGKTPPQGGMISPEGEESTNEDFSPGGQRGAAAEPLKELDGAQELVSELKVSEEANMFSGVVRLSQD